MPSDDVTRFLNVDLDLKSSYELTEIIRILQPYDRHDLVRDERGQI
jgi:hypothetical protein